EEERDGDDSARLGLRLGRQGHRPRHAAGRPSVGHLRRGGAARSCHPQTDDRAQNDAHHPRLVVHAPGPHVARVDAHERTPRTCRGPTAALSSWGVARGGNATDPITLPVVHEVARDEPLETGRYGDALRRSWGLIALIVVPLTLIVFLVSFSLPKTYRATSRLVFNTTSDPLAPTDA